MSSLKLSTVYAKVKIRAFAAWPESLINAASSAGITIMLLDKVDPNTICFDIYERDLSVIEEMAKKSSAELTVKKYRDHTRGIIKRRFMLIPIVLAVCALLFISSFFVWKIEIYGSHGISKGELLRALEDSGLYYGCFWPKIKADDIRSNIMLKLPEIAWMTVNTGGSRAVVLLNERVNKPEIYDEDKPTNLVAAKTGLVRRVSLLQGSAMVEPGQAVTAGEILASGNMQSLIGVSQNLRAKGSVMADTWYEISAVCPEKMEIKENKGISRHRFALVLGKRRINFYFYSGKAIDECDKIIKEYTLGIEGQFATPVRFVHEKITAYKTMPGQGYDKENMAHSLSAKLDARQKGQLLQSALTESSNDGLYMLTLRAHCVENIALTQEIY